MSGDLAELTVAPARPDDRQEIVAILEGAQRWLADKGIVQWTLPFYDVVREVDCVVTHLRNNVAQRN